MTAPGEDPALDQIRFDLDQLLMAHDPGADPGRLLADDIDAAITGLTASWSDPDPQVPPADVLGRALDARSSRPSDAPADQQDRQLRF